MHVGFNLLLDDMARSPLGYKAEWVAAHDYDTTVMCGIPFRLVCRRGTAFMAPGDHFPVSPNSCTSVQNLYDLST